MSSETQPTLTAADLKALKAPFADDLISVKVQSLSRDRNRALLVKYVQHTDVADRLDQVDPAWSTQIIHEEWKTDPEGQPYVFTQMRLTVKGVSRENSGEGQDPKASASDALKRCASSFGVARYLYNEPTVWVDYNEREDRFREWTVEDYKRGAGQRGQRAAAAEEAPRDRNPMYGRDFTKPASAASKPSAVAIEKSKLFAEVDRLCGILGWSIKEAEDLARELYAISGDKMSVRQLEAFIGVLHVELGKAGKSA